MIKITSALVVLALTLLACTFTPRVPTAGEASEPFPTERPAPITSTETEAAPITCRVTAAEALHLRNAPSTEGTVLAWLAHGEILTLSPTPPRGDWVKVTTAEGVPGWVNSKYCEVRHE